MKNDIKITYAKEKKRGAVLKVVGVGGGGGNAINRMIEEGLKGVDFIAVNTDVQDLSNILEPALTVQIGDKITRGLGTGSRAEVGMQAALENTEAIIEFLDGANMVFITAGMGGGTGTGASQVIANHSISMGILTVAIVTRPFDFEGNTRMRVADEGIKSLMESVDALIVIPNQKLFEIENSDISYKEAYKKVDQILLKAVRGISDIINNAGYQNVDFADVKATMAEKGMTLMGTGEAKGENRAEEAARRALNSPLLDNISINGATGILYNITASSSLSLKEIGMIADIVKENASADAKIKFGIVDDESLKDVIRVTVVATGFKSLDNKKNVPLRPKVIQQPTQRENLFEKKGEDQSYFFKKKNEPANLSDLGDYLNESSLPSMVQDPESVDDILDVPSFQRPRITEKK